MKHSRPALITAGLLLLSAMAQAAPADQHGKQYWDYGYARDYGGEFGNANSVPPEASYPQNGESQAAPRTQRQAPAPRKRTTSSAATHRAPAAHATTRTAPARSASHAPAHSADASSKIHSGECLPGFRASHDPRGNYACKSQSPHCPNGMAFQAVLPADSSGEGAPFEYRCFSPQR